MRISGITYSNYQVGFQKTSSSIATANSSEPVVHDTPEIAQNYEPALISPTSIDPTSINSAAQVQNPEKNDSNNIQRIAASESP